VVQWKLPAKLSTFIQQAGCVARGLDWKGIAVLLAEPSAYSVLLNLPEVNKSKESKLKGGQDRKGSSSKKITKEKDYARQCESPRRLDLRLHCSDITPTRRLLDIWLPFPITVSLHSYINVSVDEGGLENILAAFECRDRISDIFICNDVTRSPLDYLMTMLDKPFPILTECHLISSQFVKPMPALPETFLGGSAPHLRSFTLSNIPFPAFPYFILSSTQIQRLTLINIPDSGYISPEMMATCLAVLPNLRDLSIEFRSASRPVQRPLPPLERALLPTLTSLSFEGGIEYFEDFIARIDTPQPTLLNLTFFADFISETPQLNDFMNRMERANRANLQLDDWGIRMGLESQAQFQSELGIKCNGLDRQLSLMMQTFIQRLPLLSHVEHFEICEPSYGIYLRGQESQEGDPDLGCLQLLELFRLLISVQSLYVSKRFVPHVTATLKELTGEMTMEVLPALHSLSLEGLQPSGPVQDAIQSFVTARQLSNHPIVIQP
jgi:hypothetical protein